MKLSKEQQEDLEYTKKKFYNALKIPLDLLDDETETLYARIDKEADNYDSKVAQAIDHLTMAQAVMFEEFEGMDVNGIYTAFDDLIEKIQNYYLGDNLEDTRG